MLGIFPITIPFFLSEFVLILFLTILPVCFTDFPAWRAEICPLLLGIAEASASEPEAGVKTWAVGANNEDDAANNEDDVANDEDAEEETERAEAKDGGSWLFKVRADTSV